MRLGKPILAGKKAGYLPAVSVGSRSRSWAIMTASRRPDDCYRPGAVAVGVSELLAAMMAQADMMRFHEMPLPQEGQATAGT